MFPTPDCEATVQTLSSGENYQPGKVGSNATALCQYVYTQMHCLFGSRRRPLQRFAPCHCATFVRATRRLSSTLTLATMPNATTFCEFAYTASFTRFVFALYSLTLCVPLVCMELVQRNKPSLLEQKNQSAASAAAAKAKGKPAVAKRGGPPSMALGPPTALPLPVPKPPSAPNGSKAPVIPASVAVRKVLRKRGRAAAVEELELDMDEHEEDDVGAAEFEPKPVLRRGPTKIEGDKKAKRGGKRHSEQCWYDEAVEDPETQAKLLELEDQMPFTVVVKAGKKKIHCLGE